VSRSSTYLANGRSKFERWMVLGVAIVTAATALAACSSSTTTSPKSNRVSSTSTQSPVPGTYTFGMNDATTGPVAFAGVEYVMGAELAASQINASHELGPGVKISLEIKNGASVASTDVGIARQFVAQSNVIAAFGSMLTPDANAVKPIYEAAHMPYDIDGATDPNMASPPYIFRTAPLPQLSNETLAQMYVTAVKPKSVVYVVTSDNAGMVSQLSYYKIPFQKAGVKDLGTVDTLAAQTSFLSTADAVIAKKPAVVVVSCLQSPEFAMIKALREAGYKGTILANATIDSKAIFSASDGAIAGAPFGVHFGPQMTGAIQTAFTKAYEARFHTAPTTYSAQGAIAVQFLAAGLKKAGAHPTRGSLAEALGRITSLSNDIYGPVTFSGGQLHDPRVFVLEWTSSGKLVRWSPASS
jgi:branched-chain amino acid transport system substrate-binding protein